MGSLEQDRRPAAGPRVRVLRYRSGNVPHPNRCRTRQEFDQAERTPGQPTRQLGGARSRVPCNAYSGPSGHTAFTVTDTRAHHTAPSLRTTRCHMATCDVCGNNYDKSFTLQQGGRSGTFDSFECAIHAFAPRCAHCDCAVIGHGVEGKGQIFCCAHCAGHAGVQGVADRA